MNLLVSTKRKCLNNFVASNMLLKESVDWEINASIWLHCNNKKTMSLNEDKKKRQGAEGTDLLELQKAHPTGELVIVA